MAAPPGAAGRVTLLRNALISGGAYALYLPVAVIVARLTVHGIGLHDFGVWATLTALQGYGSILELGLATPIVKYVAEYAAQGNHRELNRFLSTSFVAYAAVAAVFICVMLLASGWVLRHIFHAAHDHGLQQLYTVMLLGFGVWLAFSVVPAAIIGVQRTDLRSYLILGFNLCLACGTIIVLATGLGVPGLVGCWLASTAVAIVANWLVARRLLPDLALNPLWCSRRALRQLVGFSSKVQVSTAMLTFNDQVDRMLIPYVLGPAMLGVYTLAALPARALRGLSFALLTPLLPAASELAALGDNARLRHLHLRASKYAALVDFGMCGGLGCLAYPLVSVWLGPGFGRVAATLSVMLAGYAVWLPEQATSHPLYAIGRPEIRMRADIAFMAMHLPLSAFLMWQMGYYGTVIGTAAALVSTRIYVFGAGCSALGVQTHVLLRQGFLAPALVTLSAMGPVIALQLAGLASGVFSLAVEAAVFAVLFSAGAIALVLEPADRALLRSSIPLLGRAKKIAAFDPGSGAA